MVFEQSSNNNGFTTAEILKIGRNFQNSDKYCGCTYETAKLLCDEIERLSSLLDTIERFDICDVSEDLEWIRNMFEELNASQKPIQYCQYSNALDKIDNIISTISNLKINRDSQDGQ